MSHAPMSGEAPVTLLERLSRSGVTGELICAADDLEVHVYLQEGRIAWATSSAARFAFGRDLCKRARIDPGSFRELVEECRRSRRPLGETLVAWQLATLEDVRESLRLQIRHALESLLVRSTASSLFLERREGYLTYARDLTFALDTVCEGLSPASDAAPEALARQVLHLVPDARWIEVARAGEVVARHPMGGPLRPSPRRVGPMAFGDGVDVVAVRAGRGVLVGIQCAPDVQAWFAPGRETRLGAVFSAVTALLPAHPVPHSSTHERATDASEAGAHGAECPSCGVCLREAIARSPDLLSAAVLRPSGASYLVAREGVDPRATLALEASRSAILHVDAVTADATDLDDAEVEALGLAHRSLVVGTEDAWLFACRVPDHSARVLWLTARRRASQGLAWALLTATARQLGRQHCAWEAP